MFSRAKPLIVIDRFWRHQRSIDLPYARSISVAQTTHHLDFTYVTRMNPGKRLLQTNIRTILETSLYDTIVFLCCSHHLATFPNRVAHGFLDINIFSRLATPDCLQGMPVIRCRQDDRIDIFSLEQLAVIGFLANSDAIFFVNRGSPFCEFRCIHVTKCDQPRPFGTEYIGN